MGQVTQGMVRLCINTMRKRNGIILTEASVRDIIAKTKPLREGLVSFYTKASDTTEGQLDTAERDWLYDGFAIHVLDFKDGWPSMMQDPTPFTDAVKAAEAAGKFEVDHTQ